MKIKNKNTAQIGTERINPRSKEPARQAKNPHIANFSLCLMAPQIAGIAPTIPPLKIEPRIAPNVKAFTIVYPQKIKSAHNQSHAHRKTQTPIVATQTEGRVKVLYHNHFVEFALLPNSKMIMAKKGILSLKEKIP